MNKSDPFNELAEKISQAINDALRAGIPVPVIVSTIEMTKIQIATDYIGARKLAMMQEHAR